MPSPFSHLLGHEAQKAYLERVLENGSLAHAYCFSGPQGIGKSSMAQALFGALLGKTGSALGGYPDFSWVEAKDGAISVDTIRDVRDRLALSSFGGGWKLVLIDGADRMNTAAQNALLKTLEEPRGKTLIVLVAHEVSRLLPTILSRSVHIRFTALPTETICKALKEKNMDPETAHVVAQWSGGAPGNAFPLLDDAQRTHWYDLQSSTQEFLQIPASYRLKMIDAWVKEAKEDRATLFERLAHIRFLLRQRLTLQPSPEIVRSLEATLATEASLRENGNISVCLSHIAFTL